MAKIAESFDVELYELFKPDIVPYDNKPLINSLSKDVIKKVNQAVKEVFTQYLK
ncbi:hypothetical protein R84B8_00939 [Treponema sp. R8-4-B8]